MSEALFDGGQRGEHAPADTEVHRIHVRAFFGAVEAQGDASRDASGAEVITITQENGRQQQQTRGGLLMLNVAHSNEVYGSMVTTLRIKNISPQPAR